MATRKSFSLTNLADSDQEFWDCVRFGFWSSQELSAFVGHPVPTPETTPEAGNSPEEVGQPDSEFGCESFETTLVFRLITPTWNTKKDTLLLVIYSTHLSLDASTLELYKRLCPSVGPSVHRSVRPRVKRFKYHGNTTFIYSVIYLDASLFVPNLFISTPFISTLGYQLPLF